MAEDSRNIQDFLATARKRFQAAAEDEKDLRAKFISDLKFASPDGDEQWDEQLKQQRIAAGRPALSFPRCHTFVAQVANEARQNKPQVKFAPRLDADRETAEIYEGLARYIQYASDAQVAYETAIEYSAGASFGYYRFLTDYCDDESDDLDLKVCPVLDPLAVYGVLVPSCFGREPQYAFVIEDIPKDEYKQKYPKSELSSLPWNDAEARHEGWVGSDAMRVAEYWYVEEKKVQGKRRPQRIVRYCKTNGFEILPGADGETSETVWPGSCIPIIPVLGKQMIKEGKPHLFSVVRPQKSAQQLINYSKSRIAESLSTSPISPFMVAEGQIDGYESEWETLNTVNRPFLRYKMIDNAGRPVPAPQRQTFEPPIQALSAFVGQEVDDMKATTGIFDASLGNVGNETSGQAILRRQQATNLSNMHFMDNLERSFRKAGDVIAELIPKIYDSERVIQILGPDEAPRMVTINKPHMDENGNAHHYDMTKGKYDVVVTLGRAFSTKRMESFDMMQQVLQTNPNLMNVIGDVFFGQSDLAGADILAQRFKALLPPQLLNQSDPAQAQAMLAKSQHDNMALNAALQQYEQQIQALKFQLQAKTVDRQGQLQVEQLRASTALSVAEMNASKDANEAFAKQEIAKYNLMHDAAHEVAMQSHQHAHERDMAEQQHAQALMQQAMQPKQPAQ